MVKTLKFSWSFIWISWFFKQTENNDTFSQSSYVSAVAFNKQLKFAFQLKNELDNILKIQTRRYFHYLGESTGLIGKAVFENPCIKAVLRVITSTRCVPHECSTWSSLWNGADSREDGSSLAPDLVQGCFLSQFPCPKDKTKRKQCLCRIGKHWTNGIQRKRLMLIENVCF